MSSRPIDEKIAKLSLDTDSFEKNASKAVKTFETMNKTFSNQSGVNLSNLEASVNNISSRFTLLGNIGQAAFQRIANTVLNLAGQMNQIFGVGGMMSGYGEYEIKLNSIQTIMVNTGESIGNVSDALNELNTYADQTIYSFSDMTRNIGLFTAAGVDLQTSVSSIKGLANLAAGMGVDNSSAARATWQLSQALGTGYVRLQDWISVENAGLGGTYFQKALVEHANELGKLGMSYDELKDKYGTFRNSLTEGAWLTNDVLAATLEDFANDETLQEAATKVKSFSQLMGNVKESVGSGWAQTWELIFGNLEEAKEFWTPISDTISGFINDSANARNKFISKWKDLGGLEATFNGLKNILTGLKHLFTPIKEGFEKLIPDITPKKLTDVSKKFEDLTSKFANADFSSFNDIISSIFTGLSGGLKTITGAFGSVSGVLKSIISVAGQLAGTLTSGLGTALKTISDNVSGGQILAIFTGAGILSKSKKWASVLGSISDAIKSLTGRMEEAKQKVSLKNSLSGLFDNLGSSLKSLSSSVKIGSIVAIAAAVALLVGSIKTLSEIHPGSVAVGLGAIGILLTELTTSFTILQAAIKKLNTKGAVKASATMILMAEAVKILSKSIVTLSEVNSDQIAQGLIAVGVGLAEMVAALVVLDGVKVSVRTSIAILAVAKACQMLGEAMKCFRGMSWATIAKGLTGMGGALAEIVAATAILGKFGKGKALIGAASILLVAQSLDEIAEALFSIGKEAWSTIKKGLIGMGGALTELAATSGILGKLTGFKGLLGAATILLAVQSLDEIAEALSSIGNLPWFAIEKGLVGMGGALAEVAIISGALGTLAGVSGLLGAGTILIAVQALEPISLALQTIGYLSWDTIGKGLVGMGGALAELAVISGATGTLTGIAGLVGAGTITLATQGLNDLADALVKFGDMSWDEIGRGLAAMGGALGETALGGLLNTFSGFGAGAIAEMAKPLGDLADSVSKWKDVTVPEGLGTQLGILAEGVMPFTLAGFGADALAKAAAPLGTMAKSVEKWKDVTVPEGIEKNLEELANGVGKFTFAGFGADALNKAAGPIGKLADSAKKWDGVEVPAGIEQAMESLANGVKKFSWTWIGGLSLEQCVGPLGSLAKSIKKWEGVTIPEGLGAQLTELATGLEAFSGLDLSSGPTSEQLSGTFTALTDSVSQIATIDFSGAINNLTSFTTALTAIPGQITSVGSSISAAATSITTSFQTSFLSGLNNVATSATSTIKTMFTTIKNSVTSNGNSIASSFTTIGTKWMSKLKSGIQNGKSAAVNAVKSAMNACKNAIQGSTSGFYTAGLNMMRGLTNGINAGGASAIAAAANVAAKALAAAQHALDEHSPSKEFFKVGMNADLGLANGLLGFISTVQSAASQMANSALSSVDSLSFDMSPSIKPVMDSSSIQSLNDIQQMLDLRTLLQDKTNQNLTDPQTKTNQLIQTLIGKYDNLIDKLNDLDVHLTLEPQELDGEVVADAVDEVYKVRDILNNYGKGGAS